MLTLKYIKDGKEIISECHSVTADRCDDGRRRIAAHTDVPGSPGDMTGYYFGEGPVKHDGRTLPIESVLYVMNRFGATVATYRFEASNVTVETRPTEELQAA